MSVHHLANSSLKLAKLMDVTPWMTFKLKYLTFSIDLVLIITLIS